MSEYSGDFEVASYESGAGCGLKIEATITNAEEWARFCGTINAAAEAMGFVAEEEPEPKPRRGGGPKLQGPPADGSTDAKVLDWGRAFALTSGGRWPEASDVADAFDWTTGIAAMRIGRLKKRGVWGVAA
jgi:hypothetical protein